MYSLYTFGYLLFVGWLRLRSLFDAKVRDGFLGRNGLLKKTKEHYASVQKDRLRILVHVASFGELEQAKPVIAKLKEHFSSLHIHLTFFSPSGYSNTIGKYDGADFITYLPYDTGRASRKFLKAVDPAVVVVVRYEVWHNFLRETRRMNVPSYLISATLRESVVKGFPLLRSLYRNSYNSFTKIFCIGESDKVQMLNLSVEAERLVVCGDTRVDQVIRRKQEREPLPNEAVQVVSSWKGSIVVVGSSWSTDEECVIPVVKELNDVLTLIVPHEIDDKHISSIGKLCGIGSIKVSEIANYDNQHIIIWNKIGDLFALYQFADVAYVGGGFAKGVHNVLEPAALGVPTIVGPNHHSSQEVAVLISQGGVVEVSDSNSLKIHLQEWLSKGRAYVAAQEALKYFLDMSHGSTDRIVQELVTTLRK